MHNKLESKIFNITISGIFLTAIGVLVPIILYLIGMASTFTLIISGLVILILSVIIITSLHSNAVNSVKESLSSIKKPLSHIREGKLNEKENNIPFEEFTEICKEIDEVKAFLNSISHELLEASNGNRINERLFAGEFKTLSAGITQTVNSQNEQLRRNTEQLSTNISNITRDINNGLGAVKSRRPVGVSFASYGEDWMPVINELKALIDFSSTALNEQTGLIQEKDSKISALEREITNLNRTIQSQTRPEVTQRVPIKKTTPKVTPQINTRRFTGGNTPPPKTPKPQVASGAYEYDRRDFGKY